MLSSKQRRKEIKESIREGWKPQRRPIGSQGDDEEVREGGDLEDILSYRQSWIVPLCAQALRR